MSVPVRTGTHSASSIWADALYNGSMDTNFPRYKGVLADRDSEYVLKSMPTAFTLGLGFAF